MIDPVPETLLDQIYKEVFKKDQKSRESGYWMFCPSCSRKVVKKELIKKGCYLCGWRGTREEIKNAQVKQMNASESKLSTSSTKTTNRQSYRTKCPQCGREVIREELEKKGCFICGYKPGKNNG